METISISSLDETNVVEKQENIATVHKMEEPSVYLQNADRQRNPESTSRKQKTDTVTQSSREQQKSVLNQDTISGMQKRRGSRENGYNGWVKKQKMLNAKEWNAAHGIQRVKHEKSFNKENQSTMEVNVKPRQNQECEGKVERLHNTESIQREVRATSQTEFGG